MASLLDKGRYLAAILALCSLSACGPALYASEMHDAEEVFERAVGENARWYAPYEYYFAATHLDKAREEAARASYEDAVHYARTAQAFSQRAIELAQRKRGGER